MTEVWTIQRLLLWTSDFFERRGIDSPRLTAELLLAHALEMERVRLYIEFDRPLEEPERARFRDLVRRRADGAPTYYLTGRRSFFGRVFHVDERVLVPRPETEHLIDAALGLLGDSDDGQRVLDLCTGSGCVGLTLLAERPNARLCATDLSPDALDVARDNARALDLEERVEFWRGDLFEPVAGRRFDLIVSNPPYVPSGEIERLAPEVRREPAMALDGGEDGLDLIRTIVAGAPEFLEPGGAICLEIGEGQGAALLELLRAAGFTGTKIERDLAGLERVAVGRLPEGMKSEGEEQRGREPMERGH